VGGRSFTPETKTGLHDDILEQAGRLRDYAKEADRWIGELWDTYAVPLKAARVIVMEKGHYGMEALHDLEAERDAAKSFEVAARIHATQVAQMLNRFKQGLKFFEFTDLDWYSALKTPDAFARLRFIKNKMQRIAHQLAFENLSANSTVKSAAARYAKFADAIEKFGIAENETVLKFVRMLNIFKPLVEVLEMVADRFEALEAFLDSCLVVAELSKNHPHQALYRFGDVVFDIALMVSSMTFFLLGSIEIVWFLVLCACIFIGKKFLNWLQELIEDPNHVSLDRKLDELRNKGMIKHLTMDEVVEQAKREGRWSNAAVIWPSG